MKSVASSGTSPENTPCLQWGLNREVTPSFGARLVQESNRLHFLSDRAGFNGAFSEDEALRLDQAFPLMLKELELRLHSSEVNPRSQHCVTLHYNGLTCEADTLGSHGYLYLTIYPTSPK